MATDTANTEKAVPVYLSFKTFQAAIQNLRTHGLPAVLDRTAFDSRSGAEQTQILSAFKFLGLIDEQQRTQSTLRSLRDAAENSDIERGLLAEILRKRYEKVFALDLENTTTGALEAAIGEYGATGTTRDRAVRFFIKAAEHAHIKLSSRLTKGLRTRPISRASASPASGEQQSAAAPNGQTPRMRSRRRRAAPSGEQPNNGAALKTVYLPNAGGSLTISGTFNYFSLAGDEQKLVSEIARLISEFEVAHPQNEEDGADEV